MSQENVELFRRGLEAYNRRDVNALLETLDPEVEWYPAILVELGGEAVYRGHEGIRALFREVDDTLAEIQAEFSEIRDLGDRIVAIGHLRNRGKASGIALESPLGYVARFKNGRVVEVRTYLEPREALAAAGLSE